MPLYLEEPKAGRSPNYRIRGTYLRVRIDESAGTPSRKIAAKIKKEIERKIEWGELAGAKSTETLFMTAANSYMEAGGERRFMRALIGHFGNRPIKQIDQAAVDAAAVMLHADATAATRNRQVYTPVIAILRHAGLHVDFRRPKGASGTSRLCWLAPEQASALVASASALQPTFGALVAFLFGTGCRLSEGLALQYEDIDLARGYAFVRKTKNGDPRAVHLPPFVVTAMANAELGKKKAFGYAKSGRLYALLDRAAKNAGVAIPDGVAFHIARHTYGAMMRRYGGLDTSGLVGTGAWKSRQAAAVYEHVDVSASARQADLIPILARVGAEV